MAKRYRDPKTMLHISYRNNKSLTGTARYASVNTHMGIEQSRRDDLEGICYVILYFLRGSLPWQGLTARNKNEKYKKIMETKMSNSVEALCKGLPSIFCLKYLCVDELQMMLKYCKSLKFEEDPNYAYIKELLKDVFTRNKYDYDFNFDWVAQTVSSEKRKSVVQFKDQEIQKQVTKERKEEEK